MSGKSSVPSDCLICIIRPLLAFNKLNVSHANFYCYHSNPLIGSPQLKESRNLKIFNMFLTAVLIIGSINDMEIIGTKFSPKFVVLIMEFLLNQCTIILQMISLKHTADTIRDYHGLIAIFKNRNAFGLPVILDKEAAARIHDTLLYIVFVFLLEEVVTLCWTIAVQEMTLSVVVRMICIEVIIIANVSFAVFAYQKCILYITLFQKCLDEVKSCFDDPKLLERLRHLQRFYLCLNQNFKLTSDFIQPLVLMYALYLCSLMIGYSYFGLLMIKHEVIMVKFDWFLAGKSVAIVVIFFWFCFQLGELSDMTERILSFLYKCPIARLNDNEAAQIQMLIYTLDSKRPVFSIYNIFTLDTRFLVSLAGTVVTYVLVALQFHLALNKPKMA